MKRIVSTLAALALLFSAAVSLTGCFGYGYSRTRRGPAMWIVEDGKGGRCCLFGSIHVGRDDGGFPFPDVIEDAFSYCDHIAVEYDIVAEEKRQAEMNIIEQAEYLRQFAYTDGTTIRDHISAETYEKMRETVEKQLGAAPDVYDGFKPALWYSLVSDYATKAAGYDSKYGVDRYFINKAYETGKTVLEIESEAEQLQLMLGIDDTVYESMILGELSDSSGAGLDYMYSIYSEGDMDKMSYLILAERGAAQGADDKTAEAMKRFDEEMYAKRNRKMADAVAGYLSEGKRVFVVVGCAHMLGDDGIVSLLRKNGYKVYRK